MRSRSMHRDRRIVVVEGAGQSERGDRRTEAPAEMPEALDEMRRQPEIVGAQLAIVLALAESGVGESLAVGVDELVFLQLVVEPKRVEQSMRMFDPERMVRDRLDLVAAFNTQLSPQVLTMRCSAACR